MKFTGSFVGSVSGSLGGITGARNRGGQYLRRRAVPTNPNTSRQSERRSNLANLVNAWTNTLEPEQQTAWTVYGVNTPTTDSLGQPLILTGQQEFLRTNLARLSAGLTTINDAPTTFNRGETPTILTTLELPATPGSPANIAVLLSAPASEAGDAAWYFGRPQNFTKNFFKGPYQFGGLTTFTAAATTSGSAVFLPLTDWPLLEGEYTPVKIRLLYDDGRVSHALEVIQQGQPVS